MRLPPESVRSVSGFGDPHKTDMFEVFAHDEAQILNAFDLARTSGRSAVVVGAQRSYNDAMAWPEAVAIRLDTQSTVEINGTNVRVGGGTSLDQLWRTLLPQKLWPRVVSGTAKTTIGGAIAMNIHGKGSFKWGAFEDCVQLIRIVSPGRGAETLTPDQPEFRAVCGGTGLFGVILEAELIAKPVPSGGVAVAARSAENWKDQFHFFDEFESTAEAMVSWVDVLGNGRGLFHAVISQETHWGFDPNHQLREGPILGVLPRRHAWRLFRWMNSDGGMRLLNALKYHAARWTANGKTHPQSLAEFNFLLDAAPGWERAYGPSGLTQFQVFAPRDTAQKLFSLFLGVALEHGHVPRLAVLKRHLPTRSLLNTSLDGYSLALDYARSPALMAFLQQMVEIVLEHDGRLYLAKDAVMTEDQFHRMHPPEAIAEFTRIRRQFDPDGLLTHGLARRLCLG